MAILFRKHERLSNLAQNSVKRYILQLYLKSASNLNGNLNCSKELEHYAS